MEDEDLPVPVTELYKSLLRAERRKKRPERKQKDKPHTYVWGGIIRTLLPQQQHAVAMLAYDSLTMRQVAEHLGLKYETVRRWRYQPNFKAALKEAQEALAEEVLELGYGNAKKRMTTANKVVEKLSEQVLAEEPNLDAAKEMRQWFNEIRVDAGQATGREEQATVIKFTVGGLLGKEVVDAEYTESPPKVIEADR